MSHISPLSHLGLLACATAIFFGTLQLPTQAADPKPVKILFLGDKGHHRPSVMASKIVDPLMANGIEIEYTEDVNVLRKDSPELAGHDGLMIYANIEKITPEQESALLAYVASGKGFIPVHCASFCFLNSEKYVELVGAQFKEHGGQKFTTVISAPDHPIMKDFSGFESWDETYTHHRHNANNRTVLEERVQGAHPKGVDSEPWSWVRTHGKGRVFYTAWGHDERTWNQPGFINLLSRGIRWACQADLSNVAAFQDTSRFPVPKMTSVSKDVAPFSFTDVGAQIPNYTPGPKWGAQDKPLTLMQDPLPPKESIKHYVTPEGFSMKLWTNEAASSDNKKGLVGKPIAMNWDERGRLWVCETIDYPNELKEQGQGRDTIRICEDTDKDGLADKFTVFAENLSIPSTLVCYSGGAIVQDGLKTVFLKDTNGDDIADFRQELITGWGLGDTHGGVSNFQYGLDNWIYGMQGYNASKPVINGVEQQAFRQGFWRFAVEKGASDATAPAYAILKGKAETTATDKFKNDTIRVTKLEFLRSTNNNTWGIGLSEEGLVFGSTANGNPSDFMPIANRYYERVNGWAPQTLNSIADSNKFAPITTKVRQVDHHGGYTAAAGHALYTARNYPKSWWNRTAFVCEPTGHLVGAFVLSRDGAGYKSTSPFNLVASDDEWSAPIMAEVGPDGNMWVLDWYNYIVQHNPTPHGFTTGKGAAYESELRDKRYGRVYRLVYQGKEGLDTSTADKLVANGLAKSDNKALVQALTHPNLLWRKSAQRLLVERKANDAATLDALVKLTTDNSTDAIGLNVGAIHALFTLDGIGAVDAKNDKIVNAVNQLTSHKSAGVRRAAVQVLPLNQASAKAVVKLLSDDDLQVRLAATLKLADIAEVENALDSEVVSALVSSLAKAEDKVSLDAWTSAAAMNASSVLPTLLKADRIADSNLDRVRIVAEHFARSSPKADALNKLVLVDGNPKIQSIVLDGFAQGWPKDYKVAISKEAADKLMNGWFVGDIAVDSKSRLLQLAPSWGVPNVEAAVAKIAGDLLKRAVDDKVDSSKRIATAKQLVVLQSENDEVVSSLLDSITPQTSPETALGIVQSLIGSRSAGLVSTLLEKSATYTPDLRSAAIQVLLGRPETTKQLLEQITAGKVVLSELRLEQRQALREHPNAAIRKLALDVMKSGGGLPNADRQKVLEAWMDITKQTGSVSNGKAMYQKHCALCHQHGSLGVNIGPNLTGMAVHPKAELLMNIIDPSRSVEGNFRTYSVLTNDGVVLTGMLAGESKTSIDLINTQGKRQTVLREDIEQLTASQKSLMPEGFEGQMTKEEMTDLLEFLTSKGKYVPLVLNSAATAVSTRGLFFDEKNPGEGMIFADWSPKVVGEVPFILIDPQGDRTPNIVMLYGPLGKLPPKLPKSVEITCNAPAAAIHILGGVGGWNFPAIDSQSVSLIVRLKYQDGSEEDIGLKNGVHMADYIRRIDVPESKFAFDLQGHQVRYLSVKPSKSTPLSSIELVKGKDDTTPIVMAMTIESP